MRKLTEEQKALARLRKRDMDRQRLANFTLEQKEAARKYAAEKNKQYRLSPEQRARKTKISRDWDKKNPSKIRSRRLKKKYGITLEQWDAMFVSQGSCCAICKSLTPGKSNGGWHTDHCHSTGKVRGILCNGCNIALGLFGDNELTMCAAACYVMEHRA